MAVSLLEQRFESLEERAPVIFPVGSPPSMELLVEEYRPDGVAQAGRRLRRSHTWSGYATRLMCLDFQHAPSLTSTLHEVQAGESALKAGPVLPIDRKEAPAGGADVRDRLPAAVQAVSPVSSPTSSPSRLENWASLLEEEWEEEAARTEEAASRKSSLSSTASTAVPEDRFTQRRHKATRKGRGAEQAAARQPAQPAAAAQPAQAAPASQPTPLTTYMVQNLSRNTTRARFLEALNSYGFAGLYDFVHVPTSFQNGRNLGFAFVNFSSESSAASFASRFQAADGTRPTDKQWRVAPAEVQGREANVAAATSGKMTRVRSAAHRPLLL